MDPQRPPAGSPAWRALRGVLAVMAFVVVTLAATPGRALAHADLAGTAPADGEHFDVAPTQVRLRFTERVNLVADAITVHAGDTRLATAPARLDGTADVVLDLPSDLGDGIYVVQWRVVSADSHPIHGAFVFSVGTASAAALNQGGALAGADPVLSGLFWTFRLLGYIGLALFAGGALFCWLCWPAGWSSRRAELLMLAGCGGGLAGAVAALLLQGPYGAGTTVGGVFDGALLRATVTSEYGGYMLARLAFLVTSGGLLLMARRLAGRWEAGARHALVVLAVVAVPVTFAGTGHANASGVLAMAATTLHLAATLGWLGGLAMLVSCVLPGPVNTGPAGTGRTVARFSRLAMVCVGVLVATGVYQAWRALGGLAALTGSSYGALLAFKVAIAGVLITVGALSRSIVRNGLGVTDAGAVAPAKKTPGKKAPGRRAVPGSDAAGRAERRAQRAEQARLRQLQSRLRRSVAIEAGIALAILALASALVATPPGRPDVVPVRLELPGAFTADLPLADVGTVHVAIDPLRVGTTRVSVDIRDQAGGALDVPEVRASMSLSESDVPALPIPLERREAGRYAAAMAIPLSGTWQVRITVRTTDFDQTDVMTNVTIP